jgi:hypothetical protein
LRLLAYGAENLTIGELVREIVEKGLQVAELSVIVGDRKTLVVQVNALRVSMRVLLNRVQVGAKENWPDSGLCRFHNDSHVRVGLTGTSAFDSSPHAPRLKGARGGRVLQGSAEE